MGFFSGIGKFFKKVGSVISGAFDTVSGFFKAPEPEVQEQSNRIAGVKVNKDSANEPVPVIYGKRRVGGIVVLKDVSGPSNEFLWIVLCICEGEIDGYEDTEIDGVPITDARFSGKVVVADYLGTDTQTADAALVASTVPWTTFHRGRSIAYRVFQLTHDPGAFPRGANTQFTQVVRGLKALDSRTSTTEFTENNAVCTRDYLTNTRFGDGMDPSALPDAEWETAADACDQLVTPFPGAPTQKLFTCAAVLDTSRTVPQNIGEMLSGFLGLIPYSEGLYKVLVAGVKSSDMSLTEDDFLGGFKFDGGSKSTRFNRVVATFSNKALDHESDEVQWPEAGSALETALLDADNGFENVKRISLPTTDDFYIARHICRVKLNESRNSGRISFPAVRRLLELDAGDVIDITHSRPGWAGKLFRCTELSISRNRPVRVTGKVHDDTDYGFETGTEFIQPSSTDLSDPSSPGAPANLVLDSGTAQLLSQGDGTQVSRIKAAWVLPLDAFVTDIVVQIKKSSDPESAYSGGPLGLVTQRHFANVEDGVAYDVRAWSINTIGAVSATVEAANHVVIGKSAEPADYTNFTIAGDELTFGPDNTEADFDGAEIRFHFGDNTSFGDANQLHTGRLIASPFTMAVRPPGPVTIMIKAFDRTGNESVSAAVIKTDLGDAPVANVVQAFDQKGLTWPGALTDGVIDGSNNLAADIADSDLMWDANPAKAMWTVDSADMWAVTTYDSMVYEATVTVAAAGLGSEMTLDSTIDGNAIKIEYRPESPAAMWTADTEPMWTADGNPMWTVPPAYETWPGSVTVANDIYNFRVTTGFGTTQGLVSKMTVTVDLPDLDEGLGDVSISAAGTRLALTKTFDTIQVVNLTLQDDGGDAVTLRTIDKNAVSGPLIKAFDDADVATTALIDAFVQGY